LRNLLGVSDVLPKNKESNTLIFYTHGVAALQSVHQSHKSTSNFQCKNDECVISCALRLHTFCFLCILLWLVFLFLFFLATSQKKYAWGAS